MNVIRAGAMGMCFGVRDALEVIDSLARPDEVTIHGELVHNAVVLDRLRDRGFRMAGESSRTDVPETPWVLITAHGVSDLERERLEAAGKSLIDTTCPLVLKAHQAARSHQRDGRFIVVIGKPGHVEVEGIVGDLDTGQFVIVASPDEVRAYDSTRIGVVCQTTVSTTLARAIHDAILARNPTADVRFSDTVCLPTRERQRALESLLERVEAVVVVGGKNSNNTRELVTLCLRRGLPAYHIQSADELEPQWFQGLTVVGLTAGTSTLDETIDEVHSALLTIGSPVAVS